MIMLFVYYYLDKYLIQNDEPNDWIADNLI